MRFRLMGWRVRARVYVHASMFSECGVYNEREVDSNTVDTLGC